MSVGSCHFLWRVGDEAGRWYTLWSSNRLLIWLLSFSSLWFILQNYRNYYHYTQWPGTILLFRSVIIIMSQLMKQTVQTTQLIHLSWLFPCFILLTWFSSLRWRHVLFFCYCLILSSRKSISKKTFFYETKMASLKNFIRFLTPNLDHHWLSSICDNWLS